MPTTLYLTTASSPLGGSGQLACSTSRGTGGVATAITNTAVSSTPIQITQSAGGLALSWWYQVGAGTINGNVSANIRGFESAAQANAGASVQIDLFQSDGTTLIGNLISTPVPATVTEYGTADSARVLAATAITSRTATNGCWIRVLVQISNAGGSMPSGRTVTNTYNGATASASGDTYVTFANTLPTYLPTPGILSTTLAPFYIGRSYSATLVSSPAADSWAVTSGALPTGISLNTSTGVLSGTPTDAIGTAYSFGVKATASGIDSPEKVFSGTIQDLQTYESLLIAAFPIIEGTGSVAKDTSSLAINGTVDAWTSPGHDTQPYAATNAGSIPFSSSGYRGNPSDFTISFWFRIDTTSILSTASILDLADSSGNHVYIKYSSFTSKVRFGFMSSASVDSGKDYVNTLGTGWNHLTLVYRSNATTDLFVNGSYSDTVARPSNLGGINSITIGLGTYPSSINDVRIFSTALSDDLVAYWMNTPATLPTVTNRTIQRMVGGSLVTVTAKALISGSLVDLSTVFIK